MLLNRKFYIFNLANIFRMELLKFHLQQSKINDNFSYPGVSVEFVGKKVPNDMDLRLVAVDENNSPSFTFYKISTKTANSKFSNLRIEDLVKVATHLNGKKPQEIAEQIVFKQNDLPKEHWPKLSETRDLFHVKKRKSEVQNEHPVKIQKGVTVDEVAQKFILEQFSKLESKFESKIEELTEKLVNSQRIQAEKEAALEYVKEELSNVTKMKEQQNEILEKQKQNMEKLSAFVDTLESSASNETQMLVDFMIAHMDLILKPPVWVPLFASYAAADPESSLDEIADRFNQTLSENHEMIRQSEIMNQRKSLKEMDFNLARRHFDDNVDRGQIEQSTNVEHELPKTPSGSPPRNVDSNGIQNVNENAEELEQSQI
jgi:hypothetical protein